MAATQRVADVNRAYFDDLAENYDTKPWQREISAQVTAELQSNIEFIIPGRDSEPRDLRLLDYACGTGVVTLALGHICKEAVGIDISSKMIQRYKHLTASHSPRSLRVSSHEGNLFAQQAPPARLQEPDLFNFDVAAVGFGFHHFENPLLCVERLAERLKPGGTLLIIDFCDDGGQLPQKAGITAHGFSEDRIKVIFERQGLVDVGYHRMPHAMELQMSEKTTTKTAFIARGIKPGLSRM